MKCPKCQHENEAGKKFCVKCGAHLELRCPKCGSAYKEGDIFCGECGTNVGAQPAAPKEARHAVPLLEEMQSRLFIPQPLKERMEAAAQQLEGQNRLVTVMFADISGFTPASEKLSPEQVAELANECFKAIVNSIVKYEGSINRFIGDSVLAFFGAPIAHENDPERAILAALDIIQAMQKLNRQVTIGINTGMVYLGSVGVDAHQEYTVEGHAANLAKRLQEAAKPGEIVVGEGTYRLTRRAFEFEVLPPLSLKGISKSVTAYKALKALPKPEKIRGIEGLRAEMIGRDREFSELKECLDELINGRGQIVSIIGEAGVGKSRLVSELKSYIQQNSAFRLSPSAFEGRCVSIGESIGYWVFIDMLRSYLELSAEDSPNDIAEKIVNKMKELFPQRWEDVVPYVGNLLSVKFGNQWDDKVKYLPAEQIKHQTFLTLRDIFLALANQKPLILILEDLHWADNLSLDLLSLLMDDLSLAPLMLLCVYRPEKEHKSWHISTIASSKCLDRYKETTLRPLSPQESRRLVESLLQIENLPEGIKESILRKSEGNPFFVEEVIRSLIESGMVYKEVDKWVAKSEIEEISVPDTIQNVIMARIDKLEEEVEYVLQSAAVIGRLFRHKLLHYTTQQERNLDRYLWQLEDRDLVYEERAIPELEYSFKHALTQETAYNTILSRRRKEFHRKVGEGYEALYASRIEKFYEELAYHYSRSDDKEKALHYLVKAGDKSKDVFLNEQAIEYYNQALKTIDDVGAGFKPALSLRGHIYQSLGEIYFPLAKHEEALEYCRQALEYTTDKKKRARIYHIMGWMCERDGKFDTALDWSISTRGLQNLETTQSLQRWRDYAYRSVGLHSTKEIQIKR